MASEFEQRQKEEIQKRVEYLEKNVDMEHSDFGIGSWIGVGLTIAVSLTMLIAGAFM